VTSSSLARTPAASLIAVLALAQAALAAFRALGFVQIGSDLVGRGVLLLPLGVIVFSRAALIAGIALLYTLFAYGTLKVRPWARRFGLIAAGVNLLLVLSVLIQGERILAAVPWCIVPAIILWHALAQPSAPRA
jgi:hypothetical protein